MTTDHYCPTDFEMADLSKLSTLFHRQVESTCVEIGDILTSVITRMASGRAEVRPKSVGR